jgi:hypothetical protein
MASLIQPKRLIGDKRDKGVFQLFCQSTDTNRVYPTGLSGTFNLELLDIKLNHAGVAATVFAFQIISDTLRNSFGNVNDNLKFVASNDLTSIPNPIPLHQVSINNHIAVDFARLGVTGGDITATTYDIVLTFKYEKL